VSEHAKRVLVVDDNTAVRRAVSSYIGAVTGFEICGEAVNGADAIEKARQLRPDLIVIDLSMPVMNGLQAARLIVSDTPAVPLILLTAHTNALMDSEARDAGISAVVSKMEDMRQLINKARDLVGYPARAANQGI
jgi:CheY-like chemotaxis protein